ncbi:hypothetical protein [Rhizobium lusitanum]|uniref:hypothetical protein n=1 Tax=Rhizobium lusitanum TaxID=293958 RepID=UPI000690CE24|nr:hypothetical protein [Rhizobium lusitanum]NTJ10404.1 hypothetical protein [Rhizobium lusitanum]
MNDLCVILTGAAMLSSGFCAGVASAHGFSSEYFVFVDPIVESSSGSDGLVTRRLAIPAQANDCKVENYGDIRSEWSTGRAVADSESGRKPFMWPWASSPAQDSSAKKKKPWHGNRNDDTYGGRSGNSGSGSMGGSGTSSAGSMGGGSTSGGTNAGGAGNTGGSGTSNAGSMGSGGTNTGGSGGMGGSGTGGSGNMK